MSVKKIVLCLPFIVALRASAFIDASLQMQLGNPSNATADTNNFSHYLIQRPIEALDYNNSRGQANYEPIPRRDRSLQDATQRCNPKPRES